MNIKKSVLIGLAALALFGLGWVIAAQITQQFKPVTPSHTLKAAQKTATGGDFALRNGQKTYRLSDFKDKIVLLYFGYTSCPDVCPTTLSVISAGLKQLTPEQQAQIQPIFISVDPERDAVAADKLMDYAKHFHPNFLGISGTPEEIKEVSSRYGAYYAKAESTSALGYLIDHTSNTYIVDRQGKLIKTMPHDMSPTDLAQAIQAAL